MPIDQDTITLAVTKGVEAATFAADRIGRETTSQEEEDEQGRIILCNAISGFLSPLDPAATVADIRETLAVYCRGMADRVVARVDEDGLIFAPGFEESMQKMIAEAGPEAGEAAREMLANLRQAVHAFRAGQYRTMEEAVEAITGQRPMRMDESDPDAV